MVDGAAVIVIGYCLCLGGCSPNGSVSRLSLQLRDGDPRTRRAAARRLGETGDRRAAAPLIAALSDPDWSVAVVAVRSLSQLRDVRAVEPLTSLLTADHFARDEAAEALVAIGKPSVDALKAVVAGPHTASVRARVCVVLGRIGDGRALLILQCALHDGDPEVRRSALEGLGLLRDRRAIAAIGHVLRRKEPSARVRFWAAMALKWIGGREAVPHLTEALADVDMDVAGEAARALREIGIGGPADASDPAGTSADGGANGGHP